MAEDAFDNYLGEINKAFLRGDATEHTHRPTLKVLIEALDNKITATNEPKRRTDCGAPDMLVSRRKRKLDFRVGYIECKDIGTNLKKEEKGEQIKKRYLPSLHNFILTNYIDYRWYTNGELRLTAQLAQEGKGGKFKQTLTGIQEVNQLLQSFLEHEAEKVASAKELAIRMGHLARFLRDVTRRTFEQEEKTGPLHTHLAAFRKVILHGLNEDEFADMYAQAIAYGLFAAWCHIEGVTVFGKDKYAAFHGMDLKAEKLTREHAAYLLPKTNPFLRKIFGQIVGPELDDRLAWLVDDLVELLREAKMDSVLKGFGKKGGRRDPVVHFYETFLKEYDPKLRELRGVYYTPDEVVSYIVRSVDWLLKEKFELKRGLADETKIDINGEKVPKVLILDPAVGTGTFLVEIINEIYKKFKRQKGLWSSYVKSQLLSRLFGFEFMMAPYAIAHTRIGLKLSELEYDFETDERLGIYLTNTLEEAQKITENVFIQGLSEEATEANKVKKDLPIMVVIGNPPYSGHSANRSWEKIKGKKVLTFIGRLVKDYYKVDGKPLGERNPKWLQDDYVKFIRFAQWRIEQTGAGILAFITNHSYLDNPTFRGMRQQLINAFSEIYILDLHGSTKKKETCPDGSKDVNVFDIQQGVTIGIFVKIPGKKGTAKIYHEDYWGLRKIKYKQLSGEMVKNTDWIEYKPRSPFYLFRPQKENLLDEWEGWWKITDIEKVNGWGIATRKDYLLTNFTEDELRKKIDQILSSNVEEAYELGVRDNPHWSFRTIKEKVGTNSGDRILPYMYRPFDMRYIFYEPLMIERGDHRLSIAQHFLRKRKNVGLLVSRTGAASGSPNWDVQFCSSELSDLNLFRRGGAFVFPLYLYEELEKNSLFDREKTGESSEIRVANLSHDFVRKLSRQIKLEFVSDGHGDLKDTFGPEDVFDYIYGVFNSQVYRSRYAEFLKIDFPRVPLPKSKALFRKLCEVGEELSKLHLMEAPVLEDDNKQPAFPMEGNSVVEKGYPKYIAHSDRPQEGKVYINKDQYFEGISPDVWEFHIGGYKVCEKWLKDRRGRELSFDDIRNYQKVVVALEETIRLMKVPCLSEMFD